jgi:hypothetical protein
LFGAVIVEQQSAYHARLGAPFQELDHMLQRILAENAVGIQKQKVRLYGLLNTYIARGGKTEISGISNDFELRLFRKMLSAKFKTGVGRRIIYHQHFTCLGDRRMDALREEWPGVVIHDND